MPFQSSPKVCPICKQGKEFKFIRDFKRTDNTFSLYQCHKCLVQFWLPLEIVSRNWYEEINPYEVRVLANSKIYRGYHKAFSKKYKSFPKNTNVLDLGCGTGEFIAELKRRGCNVWGLDFDRKAIGIAKERFGLENVYAVSFEDFLKRTDLPSFDVITFFEVIEHLDNPLGFILNVKRLLKPGGKIIFSTPCRERMLPNFNMWDFPPHHFTRWNAEAILEISRMCGFEVSCINYVEQLKILSESLVGKFKTGLVGRSLGVAEAKNGFRFLPQIVYFFGRFKDFVLGMIPATFLWLFGRIIKPENGIMLVEIKEKDLDKLGNKKVVFFIPILTMGGGERVVSELTTNLSDSIEKVIVLLENKISYPYKGKIICLNIPISNPFILRIFYFFVVLYRFGKVLRKEKPDYVISFGTPANIISVLSGKRAILRVDNFLSSSSSIVYKILIKLLFNKAFKIICVSKASAEDLIKNFGINKNKIKVIYNPLNIEKIQLLARESLDDKYVEIFKKPVVISMGRMSKQKGQWHLIRAFSELKKTINGCQLVILGSGELEEDLKRITRGLGINDDVHFLGWQENPFKFLAKAKVFVLSSLWEGLPYVILEAMACGLPIISADCRSGPREILAPETNINQEAKNVEHAEYGILTPTFYKKKYGANTMLTKSEDILNQAMVELLSNKKMADDLINKSKKRAEDFDIKNIIKEWEFLEH